MMRNALREVYSDLVVSTMREDRTSADYVEQRIMEIITAVFHSEQQSLLAEQSTQIH